MKNLTTHKTIYYIVRNTPNRLLVFCENLTM